MEGRTHHVVRMDAANGRHSPAEPLGSGGGSSSDLASLGAGQPARLLAVRRGPTTYVDGEPVDTPGPVMVAQLLQEQQQYHPHLYKSTTGQHPHHLHHVSVQQQQQQQLDSGDEEAGTASGLGRRPATPLSPGSASPPAMHHHGRLALLSMLLLVFQGTALSIMLRYSRARSGQPYLASVSVIFTEVIKLLICAAMQFRHISAELAASSAASSSPPKQLGGAGSQQAQQAALWREVKRQTREIAVSSLPMLLPAGMFVMQQVLLIVAASHLDAVAFQIFSQSFKLVPTALFAYWLLGQQLEPMQWASIPVLALGVILVTVNNGGSGGHASAAAAAVSSSSSGLDYVAGMVACSVSGLSSAYAGVYFEKYVKGRNAASLWVRNIQLGMYGVPLSTAYAIVKDGQRIWQGGPMQGFDAATWSVVALQVFGGLVTGMVVKYCDNILKNFALAISVILTVLVAIPLFGQWPSPIFLVGVALVLLSVFMYGRALDTRKVQQWWQKALKRWLPQDTAARYRQLLALLLAASAAAGFVLLGSSLASSQSRDGGRPLRGSGRLNAADVAAQLAALDGEAVGQVSSGAKRSGAAGLRSVVGQLLKDSATQQQLIADGGRLLRHQHRSHAA